jgi:predicted Rossmann fold flavoprotein
MTRNVDTLIIGAGPAGLFTAANISFGRVIVLEKKPLPGRKLLIAGSGRCNITHSGAISDFLGHYGEHTKFIRHALYAFNNQDLIQFFHNRELQTYEDKNGKVFPVTDHSSDVLEVLIKECRMNSAEIKTGTEVINISKADGLFRVSTSSIDYHCRYLVIATGGLSYPGTGSTGDGYRFAVSLGHTLVHPKPSLTPVFIDQFSYSDNAGISLPFRLVSIYRKGKKVRDHHGDLGITHKGLSGPAILDASRFMEPGDLLKVNIIDQKPELFNQELLKAIAKSGKQALITYLKAYDVPRNLLKSILANAGMDPDIQLAMLRKEQRKLLTEVLCEHNFLIDRLGGFRMAMVTAGGISLEEIRNQTMESKLVDNLFFAGEVMDIDGDTGGYNLQAAFSSGFTVAKTISEKMRKAGNL